MTAPGGPAYHVPVLLDAVLAAARGARRAVDATLGDGGHAAALRAAGIEVLGGPQQTRSLTADTMGRFTTDTPVTGPFALRLRTGGEVVVTEWTRA